MKRKDLTNSVRSYNNLSFQDYGAYVDTAELFEYEGRLILCLAAGYQTPDNEDWYELDAQPTKWPEDGSDNEPLANPGTDQSEDYGHGSDLFHAFGVNGKKIDAPTVEPFRL